MTQIRSRALIMKRPGELGVHSLDHFALTVPDLRVAQDFYKAFGLDLRDDGNMVGVITKGDNHRWGLLREGSRKCFGFASFAAYEEDFPLFRARLSELGIPRLDPPAGIESNGLWFRDPDGNLLEICIADKSSPSQKSSAGLISSPAGIRGATGRTKAPIIAPRRFAHLLLFTPDVPRAVAFYSRALGLRLSDQSADVIAFMHGPHGSDHHMLAFAKSSAPGLHHLSWDVGTVNDIGLGAKQMLDKGFEKGWGLGRHVLGSNYFHYVRDPWGSYCEYSCDIDYVPVDCDWRAADHEPMDSIYVWGPDMPRDFIHNYEAAG